MTRPRPITLDDVLGDELVLPEGFDPVWTDDGTRLAFVDAEGLVVVDAKSGIAIARPN